jgi:hypothetical protein
MKTEKKMNEQRPLVLSYQPIRFETAQSWNRGHGNRVHFGNGNNGVNYPNEPYTGERPQEGF